MHQSARSVAGFWILAAMLLVSVASSAVPSPIYPVYAAEWHLTPLMLTGVFAIYVAGLLASLLVAGRLSDHVGRKPVLVVGGLGVALSLGLFAMADGVVALIVDRIVQGVSVGLLIGALGAALIDNSLERHPTMAGVLNGVIPPIALATGAMSSGALVQWGPAPEQLVYLLFGALLVLLVLALFVVPEQVQRRPGALRSLRPTISVPRSSRRLFRGVAGSLVASWALGGMFLSLVPSALGTVFGITNHFAAGALIAVVTGVGALTGLAIQRMDTRRAVLLGLVALVLGPIVTVSFVFAHSLPGMVVGSAIAGVGFGAGFQAPLRMLLATAAPTHRAGLLSTIYVVSYLAFGVPSVIGGLLEPSVGLVPVIAGYGGFIVLAAVVALVLQLSSKDAAEVEERAAEVIERTATGSIRVAAE
ncbi:MULTISPECIES: MFS transporter [Curtobacterium]|jgi:MFS family permease|uniref:MFS transporter n=1 Tax=Curtobacterium TaxID=2034 RepID=UPI000DA98F69|nr:MULTISPECIES: MFS transporter [Curtobacterium]MBF4595577.1 MFS transporter [Curtobacterium flaccumfaciens]MBF4629022.1 MFS transporter [Curtobacterium flaccumfaciens]MBT1683215.1 MFS transporter [Curtobacterium flaccumfaciens pv. flaccumfaciens]MCS6552281.1 MFS transporter [Curtobacterium flaccumfaciens pv. flaccumfaciens]MCS6556829.1 MFS transporter [Curtobacterium flaccumfaciens]